ncbi:MAG: hypothetical protein WCE79_05730 [Xanthobacteraceae bacterium]
MIANTPRAATPAPLAPSATATPRAIQYSVAERRHVCRMLQLYRFCSLARCRRMRGCHGEPQRCLATHGAAVPHEACVVAEAVLVAARYNCVRAGTGDQWLKETYRRERAVFNAFIAALESRDLRKKGYALLARFRRSRKRALNAR